MPALTVNPTTVAPGDVINVSGSGFDPKSKFALTTVDKAGTESGFDQTTRFSTNINRPRKDGMFTVGIFAPPLEGLAKVKAYKVTPATGPGKLPTYTFLVEATFTVGEPPVVTPPIGVPRVTTIEALLNGMADDDVTEIVLASITHSVKPAAAQIAGQSLWIGNRFARRTNPLIVRWDDGAPGLIDGNGASYFGGVTFADGVHDIDWRVSRFDNGNPFETGVVVFGGYKGLAPIRNVWVRDAEFLSRLWSHAGPGVSSDHAIYVSYGAGTGCGVEGVKSHPNADPNRSLDSILHFYHGEDTPTTDPNANGFTMRGFDLRGSDQFVILWDTTARSLVLEDGIIDGAGGIDPIGVRWERGGPLTLRRVQTRNTVLGFYSGTGKVPVYDGCKFDPVTKELVLT